MQAIPVFDEAMGGKPVDEQQPPADLLNENHRSVLAGTLRRVELEVIVG